jgi:hypothetical protein
MSINRSNPFSFFPKHPLLSSFCFNWAPSKKLVAQINKIASVTYPLFDFILQSEVLEYSSVQTSYEGFYFCKVVLNDKELTRSNVTQLKIACK